MTDIFHTCANFASTHQPSQRYLCSGVPVWAGFWSKGVSTCFKDFHPSKVIMGQLHTPNTQETLKRWRTPLYDVLELFWVHVGWFSHGGLKTHFRHHFEMKVFWCLEYGSSAQIRSQWDDHLLLIHKRLKWNEDQLSTMFWSFFEFMFWVTRLFAHGGGLNTHFSHHFEVKVFWCPEYVKHFQRLCQICFYSPTLSKDISVLVHPAFGQSAS